MTMFAVCNQSQNKEINLCGGRKHENHREERPRRVRDIIDGLTDIYLHKLSSHP